MEDAGDKPQRRQELLRSSPMKLKRDIGYVMARTKPTESGCLEWQLCCTGNNKYGAMELEDGTTVRVHRFMWEQVHGPIPAKLNVLHRCDNPKCCRVEHLFLGTQQDNMRDMAQKKRANPRKGSTAPQTKLTESQVLEIRQRYYHTAVTVQALCLRYSLSESGMLALLTGTTWAHVPHNKAAYIAKTKRLKLIRTPLSKLQTYSLIKDRAAGMLWTDLANKYQVSVNYAWRACHNQSVYDRA